ncbi:uncharacterized protein N7515_009358 [Penicillium bovifimosum]|uniref:Uncharacterized protein n=1 Tax=Penicillium bovifimosum TaxID=126998 RepID=A0A9W9GJ52_9EURO|nr:uncharacterized protein N7515_009358 [Penicillium bovifimosum]KAJ5121397.1 hypothetical protein N7515_009358 [Penicillium bovifimosum]
MGNKVSAVRGVKSDHFYDQGNAINEIWVGDVEIISRLPFGDSDLEQAGWPIGGFPKIPWRHFIIPMHKRDEVANPNMTIEHIAMKTNDTLYTCRDTVPEHGYLGMFTGISPELAGNIGFVLLGAAIGLFMGYTSISRDAFRNWWMLRKTAASQPDPVRFRRNISRHLWIGIGLGYIALSLSVVCLLLALPAIAACWRGVDASTLVFLYGKVISSYVLVFAFVLQPLVLLWLGRRGAKRYPLEEIVEVTSLP